MFGVFAGRTCRPGQLVASNLAIRRGLFHAGGWPALTHVSHSHSYHCKRSLPKSRNDPLRRPPYSPGYTQGLEHWEDQAISCFPVKLSPGLAEHQSARARLSRPVVSPRACQCHLLICSCSTLSSWTTSSNCCFSASSTWFRRSSS